MSDEKTSKRGAIVAGPAVALVLCAAAWLGHVPDGWSPEALMTAGVGAWMAIWWIAEAIPLGATSLLPLALFPLLAIAPIKVVTASYMHPFIVLLMAGFMAALAIERWDLHKRLALRILLGLHGGPGRLVLGMMIASAVCSMWISNTATTLMLLPIAMALVARAEAAGEDEAGVKAFGVAMFLGVAYAASIGGLATPIGTPPNLVFLGVYHDTFPDLPPIAFADWMLRAGPITLIMLPLVWILLTRVLIKVPAELPVGGRDVLQDEHDRLGRANADEWAVGGVFVAMAVLWVTRRVIIGDGEVVGWAPALGLDKHVNDATVAVLGALTLFVWPSRTKPGQRLLDWPTAARIPWEVVLLFGGGIALADMFKVSGLSVAIANGLTGLGDLPVPLLIGTLALAVTFLTEVTSNTATSTILMPVLAAFAAGAKIAPELVMIPAVLSASCAFMLPVATAPNAIVYGSGKVPIKTMARTGFALNLVGAGVITLWCWLAL